MSYDPCADQNQPQQVEYEHWKEYLSSALLLRTADRMNVAVSSCLDDFDRLLFGFIAHHKSISPRYGSDLYTPVHPILGMVRFFRKTG